MKIWNMEEENLLLEEVNNLLEIEIIASKHKRTVGGVRARIKKIIVNNNLNIKLDNLSEVVKKYFSGDNDEDLKKLIIKIKNNILSYKSIIEISTTNKISENQCKKILLSLMKNENDFNIKDKIKKLLENNNFNETELLDNILEYNNIDEIKKKFHQLKNSKLIMILTKFLKNDNLEINKKQRINYILKKENDDNFDNNTESNKTEHYLLIKAINNFHDELKDVKSEIFDINNRIKLLIDKIDGSHNLKINKSKNLK